MSQLVFKSQKFQRWKQRVEANGNIIKNIEIMGVISRKKNDLYGVFLDCILLTPEGVEIPRCIIIRGDSVVIIPVLKCTEDKELYTLLVEQRCITDGGYVKEFPAGNVNMMEDTKAMACQEILEEIEISVSPEELIPLTTKPIIINPSLTDDMVHFFYFEREITFSFLKNMNGRSTGCHEEHEYLYVRAHKMSEIVNLSNSSILIGMRLLERALCLTF